MMETSSSAGVALHGSGIAAATLAHLLAGEGVPVLGLGAETSKSVASVVMLGEQAVGLLHDVFQRPLFTGAHRIERRVVRWGGGEPAVLPHRAIAVSGADLHAALPPPQPVAGDAAFTVHASAPFPDETLVRFGHRQAAAAPVQLTDNADQRAALVEATDSGWLFLIPRGEGRGWVLSVGGEPDALLGSAPLVSASVSSLSPVESRFETAPRMLQILAGPGWLALGQGALAFDPICGDGTATAVRAALLAAAIIHEINAVSDHQALLGHYRAMLVAAMRRHLQVSLPFYRSGGTSPWWRAQADALAQGHALCTSILAKVGEPRFVLCGNRLILRDMAA